MAQLTLTLYGETGREKQQQQQQQPHLARPSCAKVELRVELERTNENHGLFAFKRKPRTFCLSRKPKLGEGLFGDRFSLSEALFASLAGRELPLHAWFAIDIPDVFSRLTCTQLEILTTRFL